MTEPTTEELVEQLKVAVAEGIHARAYALTDALHEQIGRASCRERVCQYV